MALDYKFVVYDIITDIQRLFFLLLFLFLLLSFSLLSLSSLFLLFFFFSEICDFLYTNDSIELHSYFFTDLISLLDSLYNSNFLSINFLN